MLTFLVTILAAGPCTVARDPADAWRQIGPFWASARSVEVAALGTALYGVGSGDGAGVFASGDSGATWQTRSEGLELWGDLTSRRVSAFAADPEGSGLLLCACTDDGLGNQDFLYRSPDGGVTWHRVLDAYGSLDIDLNGIDARNDTIWVGAGPRLFRSGDGGMTWTLQHTFANGVATVAVAPSEPLLLLVGTSYGGLWRSANGGLSFGEIPGFSGVNIRYVGFIEQGGQTIGVLTTYPQGLWMSTDGGATWLPRAAGLPGVIYEVCGSVVSSTLYAAGASGAVFRTDDLGVSWEWCGSTLDWPYPFFSQSIMSGTSISRGPDDAHDVLYLACNGGVQRSVDGGCTWSRVGVPSQGILGLDFPDDGLVGFAGGPVGVERFGDGQWQGTPLMAELGVTVHAVALDPAAPSRALIGITNALDLGYVQIWRTEDTGATWQIAYNGSGIDPGVVSRTLVNPTNTYQAFASFFSLQDLTGGLLRSADGGETFSKHPTFDGVPVTGLDLCTAHPNVMYAASAFGEVWRSLDGGVAWAPGVACAAELVALSAHPLDSDRVWAGGASTGPAVWRSDDGGLSWVDAGFGPGWVSDLQVTEDGIVFISTHSDGMYAGSEEGGWVSISEGLGNPMVDEFWLGPTGSPDRFRLRAATCGGSIWECTVARSCRSFPLEQGGRR